jgi:site-specific DNA recombinase
MEGFVVHERHIYREVHTGTELWQRPRLTTLREAVRTGQVGAVIVYAVDRLTRSEAHFAIIKQECARANVKLYFVNEHGSPFELEGVAADLVAVAAQLERENIRDRARRGRQARLASGKLPSSMRPFYGYCWRDASKSALAIDPDTAPIARRIFAEALNGSSLRKIAERLNAERISTPTTKGKWYFASIRKLLLREEYTGVAFVGKEHTEHVIGASGERKRVRTYRPAEEWSRLPADTIPALIDRDTFEAIRERLERNKDRLIREHRTPERFLLRAGFICCGYCGKSIGAYRGYEYRQNGRIYRVPDRYRANRHNTDCPLVWHDAAELDAAVTAIVGSLLGDEEQLSEAIARQRRADTTREDRRSISQAIDATDTRRSRLIQALQSMSNLDAEQAILAELQVLAGRLDSLRQERTELETRYMRWRRGEQQLNRLIASTCARDRSFSAMTLEERRHVLRILGIRVQLFSATTRPRYKVVFKYCPS